MIFCLVRVIFLHVGKAFQLNSLITVGPNENQSTCKKKKKKEGKGSILWQQSRSSKLDVYAYQISLSELTSTHNLCF